VGPKPSLAPPPSDAHAGSLYFEFLRCSTYCAFINGATMFDLTKFWAPRLDNFVVGLHSASRLRVHCTSVCFRVQGRNEDGPVRHNSPDAESLLGPRRMTVRGAEKSKQSHKYFLQYSTFASERPQVRTWGPQTCFLPPGAI